MTRKLIHAEVGARIAQVRRQLGLKRYEFAKVLGVTPATAGNYEMGQMRRADILDRVARAGHVTVEWLLHGPEERGKKTASKTHGLDINLGASPAWLDTVPRDLVGLPPRYLYRYQARLREAVSAFGASWMSMGGCSNLNIAQSAGQEHGSAEDCPRHWPLPTAVGRSASTASIWAAEQRASQPPTEDLVETDPQKRPHAHVLS